MSWWKGWLLGKATRTVDGETTGSQHAEAAAEDVETGPAGERQSQQRRTPHGGLAFMAPSLLSGAMTLMGPVVIAQSCPEGSEAPFMIAD